MSSVWINTTIEWHSGKTWLPSLSKWIRPYLNQQGIKHLKLIGQKDICWDDSAWFEITQKILKYEIDYVLGELSGSISKSIVRAYHCCRTENVGDYERLGINQNNFGRLSERVISILESEPCLNSQRREIEERLLRFEERNFDSGKVFLALDYRSIVKNAGHYLIYGSEFIQSVIGQSNHKVLRRRGAPTIISVNLPMNLIDDQVKMELANSLLREWTRNKVNRPNWTPEIDFTLCVRGDVSSNMIVGHFHPESVRDPFYQGIARKTGISYCPSCEVRNNVQMKQI